MAYITNADIEERLGSATYVQLADDDGDNVADVGVVDEARLGADGEVSSYLGRRFQLPIDPVGVATCTVLSEAHARLWIPPIHEVMPQTTELQRVPPIHEPRARPGLNVEDDGRGIAHMNQLIRRDDQRSRSRSIIDNVAEGLASPELIVNRHHSHLV